MKCTMCHEEFDPGNLAEVFEHQHAGEAPARIEDIDRGVFVGRRFTEEQSVNVEQVRLNRDDLSFDVHYRNGQRYRYLDVPVEVMESCENVDSIGGWLSLALKGRYRYYHLNGD